jgi:hypothetical protein
MDGKGRIFDNTVDKTKEKQPDWTGTIMHKGEHIHLSGWYYPPSERNRVATISLATEGVQERQDRIAAAKARKAQDGAAEHGQPPAPADDGLDSDIPF